MSAIRQAVFDLDEDVRTAALEALVGRSVWGGDFRLAAVRALADPNAKVRESAVRLLATRSIEEPEIKGLVRNALRDFSGSVRFEAAARLAAPSEADVGSLPGYLAAALRDESADVRAAAVGHLLADWAEQPEAVRAVQRALTDPDGGVRAAALAAPEHWAGRPESGELLLAAVRDPDSSCRKRAVELLASYSGLTPEAHAALERATRDEEAEVRHRAFEALADLLPEGELPGLVRRAVQDPAALVRRSGFTQLFAAGQRIGGIEDLFAWAHRALDSEVAFVAFAATESERWARVPTLQELSARTSSLMTDEHTAALFTLATQDPETRETRSAIEAATVHAADGVRRMAFDLAALRYRDQAWGRRVVAEATRDTNAWNRAAAIQAVLTGWPEDAQGLGLPWRAVGDEAEVVRTAALAVLMLREPTDEERLRSAVEHLAADSDYNINDAAQQWIVGNSPAEDARRQLNSLLRADEVSARRSAIAAMALLYRDDPATSVALRRSAGDPAEGVRRGSSRSRLRPWRTPTRKSGAKP